MRKFLICIAAIGGLASIALCSLYGWKQATSIEDQLTAAIQYGLVALFAFVLDVVAVRVWISGWHKAGAFIGFAALSAFLMTATTSLGGMVTRSDRLLAERQGVLSTKQDAETRIAELAQEKRDLGAFKRTTRAAVDAAQRLADTAKEARVAECGNGEPRQRGRLCRDKEDAEGRALDALAQAAAAKASTDRAGEIEVELKSIREKRATAGGDVAHVNPLGAALALIMGSAAEVLTARQQAIFAFIFDLCLVAIMVGIEVLGHTPVGGLSTPKKMHDTPPQSLDEATPATRPAPSRPRLVASTEPFKVYIYRIMGDALSPAKGGRVELGQHSRGMRQPARPKAAYRARPISSWRSCSASARRPT